MVALNVPSAASNIPAWIRQAAVAINALLNDANNSDAVIPLVDGSEPPAFITDGAGNLIVIAWSE